eukprot:COSAG02_NODE_2373_length_9022_cov_6.299675_6_plen_231_part_00
MSELETPRHRDDDDMNLDEWSSEIESLLSEFGEIALCYSWLHSFSTRKYKAKYHRMSIPIIVLSTLTGTANFADSYVPDGFKQGFSACVGGLNIFCGILGTLMSFLKYAEIYEAHRIAALAWSSLGRSIQIELALKDERRKNCRDFLKVSRATYDSLLESSPTLDQDVIQIFNKRFNKEYPNVSKPIVCNGLREIKVYDPSEHLKRDVSVDTKQQDEETQQIADDENAFG